MKLHSDGITHIFGAGYPFMLTANEQLYHRRYFITLEPRVYAENAPASQLVGSIDISLMPSTGRYASAGTTE